MTMNVETTRAKRAKETRAKIFAAASTLMAEGGYHNATVDRIATRAGVAKATFFVHFASKAEVVKSLVMLQTQVARRARLAALVDGPVAALRAMVFSLGDQAAMSRATSRGVIAATLESEELGGAATALFDEVLLDMTTDARAAKRAGLFASHVVPEHLASSLLASYFGAVLGFSLRPSGTMNDTLVPLVEGTLSGALTR